MAALSEASAGQSRLKSMPVQPGKTMHVCVDHIELRDGYCAPCSEILSSLKSELREAGYAVSMFERGDTCDIVINGILDKAVYDDGMRCGEKKKLIDFLTLGATYIGYKVFDPEGRGRETACVRSGACHVLIDGTMKYQIKGKPGMVTKALFIELADQDKDGPGVLKAAAALFSSTVITHIQEVMLELQ